MSIFYPYGESSYIYGLHQAGGEKHMVESNNEGKGWIVFTETQVFGDTSVHVGYDQEQKKPFSEWADKGYGVIVRLNRGYHRDGTLPYHDDWEAFKNWVISFVTGSSGAHIWMIGNEMNLPIEWPRYHTEVNPHHNKVAGASPTRPRVEVITAQRYADLFKLCRDAIRSIPGHRFDQVIIGGVAPWNKGERRDLDAWHLHHDDPKNKVDRGYKFALDTTGEPAKADVVRLGDWVLYYRDILDKIGPGNIDGISLHTYSRPAAGRDVVQLIVGEKKREKDTTKNPPVDPAVYDPPYDFMGDGTAYDDGFRYPPPADSPLSPPTGRPFDPECSHLHNGFRSYRDFLAATPLWAQGLPIYITEANRDQTWPNVNDGWIQTAYKEINDWNNKPGTAKIRAMCLYRWYQEDEPGEKDFHLGKASNAIEDFVQATKPTLPSETGKSYRWDRLIAHPTFETLKTATEAANFGWIWGPVPRTAGLMEAYAEAPGGARFVQYFDKARMEINNPANPSIITTGLLVTDMIDGRVQVGDNSFETRSPSDECIAGDPKSSNLDAPTYASFKGTDANPLPAKESDKTGALVTQLLLKNSALDVLTDPPRDPHNNPIKFAHFITDNDGDVNARTLSHNIPKVFHDYLLNTINAVVDKIFSPNNDARRWVAVMGYPIREAYWVKVKVAGAETMVLAQPFQRRVLTYTKSNPSGYQVEMGNVGLHYLNWRYQQQDAGTPSIAARKVGPQGPGPMKASSLSRASSSPSRNLTAGQQSSVAVTLQNIGTSPWTSQGNRPHWLEAANEHVRALWGVQRVALPNVLQGAQATFNVTLRVPALQPGTYRVPLRVAQEGADKSGNYSVIDVMVDVGQVAETSTYEGYLDVVNCAIIWGWAWDSNRPNTPIDVELFYHDFDANNQLIEPAIPLATLRADLYREDIVRAGKGNGCHGFSFTPPDFLFNGQRRFIKATVDRGRRQLLVSNTSPSFKGELATYSGRVVDLIGNGIAQATVTLTSNNAPPRYAIADAVGNYSFANLRTGRGLNYALSASSPYYNIVPPAATFDGIIGNQPQANSASTNFQGSIRRFKISGKVLTVPDEAGVLVKDMEILLTGGPQPEPVKTRTGSVDGVDRGLYKFDDVKAGREYTVQPSDPNYNFFPPSVQTGRLASNHEITFLVARKRHKLDVSVKDDSPARRNVAGALARLSGWETKSAETTATGLATFLDLRKGRPYTVEVTHKHFVFNPLTQSTPSVVGLDRDTVFAFNGKLRKHDISVLITDNTGFVPAGAGANLLDVTLRVSGGSALDPTVNFNESNQPAVTMPTNQQTPRYTIRQLPAGGNYTVTPTHDYFDFTPPSRTVTDLSNPADWTFQARRRKYSVGGYIKDVYGTPLKNVVVKSSGALAVQATTDVNGFYDLPGGLYAGLSYNITPTPLPGMSFDFPETMLLATLTQPLQLVNFKGGYTLSGHVLDRRSRGIPRVKLTLVKPGSTTPRETLADESTGHFQFKFLAPGAHNYLITPSRDGMLFSKASVTVNELTGNYTAVNFTGGHTVSGQITDAFATPAIAQHGVSVALSSSDYNDIAETGGAAGMYRFELVPPGDNYIVTPTKEGFTFDFPSQSVSNLQYHKPLAFKGGYTIGGRVTNHSGQGIEGVTVKLTRTLRGATAERTAFTDANGQYSFKFLTGAAHVGQEVYQALYSVTAIKAGYSFQIISPPLDLPRGSRTVHFTQLLTISGSITGDGRPLSGVNVQLSGRAGGPPATTDADGRYTFTLLPSKQTYIVTPTLPMYVFAPDSQNVLLTTADQTADFAGRQLRSISGTVSLSGIPLANVRMELTLSSSEVKPFNLRPVPPSQVIETDQKGRYTFTFLPEKGITYTVAPARGEQTYEPQSQTFSDMSGDQKANFESQPTPPQLEEKEATLK